MHVALVASFSHPLALGLRYVAAYLKAHGHAVDVYFFSSRRDTAAADFAPALLANFIERARAADLIGVSLMTNTFYRARAITQTLKQAGIATPIIWGGPHPTVAPEECAEVADFVCIGEGERPMLEFVEALHTGRDPRTVSSLAWRANGALHRNPMLPLDDDLDVYPFPDFDLDTHWVAARDHFEPAGPRNLRDVLRRYRIESTRGCPYHCSFCNNTAWQNLYHVHGTWVRQRSNENVIAELEQVGRRFPGIEEVNIVDDLFFIRSAEEIDAFGRLYRERVNLPLELDAFPNTVTPAKVEALARLPVSLVSMGIQSGCPETLKDVYDRPTPLPRVIEAINLFADHRLPAEYHYLTNNPFESNASRLRTLRFAATHHRGPAKLRLFPLQFYPGAPLYERARSAGILARYQQTAYHDTLTARTLLHGSTYLEVWLRVVLNLRNWGVPVGLVHRLIDVVASRPMRWVFDRRWFVPAVGGLYLTVRLLYRTLIHKPFVSPLRHLWSRARAKPARHSYSAAWVESGPGG
ncbi:MAG TPA: radical SAM protein [Phycisphaerae bacterium]|nr:radical SAM protein [Phycisphaerae bacterium]HNU45553.1 radical SAM protein [Phycisphaerae bacterium]